MTTVNRRNLNRRIFLRGLGGACLAAPFLPSVQERFAKAQGVAPEKPVRSVLYFTHNGCVTDYWFPSTESGPVDAAALSGTTLEPLTPFASKLLFPRGLKAYNSYGEIQTVDPHDQAMGSKLTCATIDPEGSRYATSHSIDHEIAKQVNPANVKPLVLSVGGGSGTNIKDVMSFSAAGEAYPAIANPQTVYSNLTQLLGTGTGEPSPDDYKLRRGKGIADLVRGDLESLQRLNMSSKDKQRLSDWLDLLTDVTGPVQVAAGCTEDNAVLLGVTPDSVKAVAGNGFGSTANISGATDMMFKLMALTMMCDANRSFIFTYPGYFTFNWDGIVHEKDHHGLSHRVGSAAVGGACYVDSSGVSSVELLHQIDKWFVGKYVKLIETLDGIDEGDGKMLDNCLVTWTQEISDGAAHNTNNQPMIIAGSGGGYLKQGVIVQLDDKPADRGKSTYECGPNDTNQDAGFSSGSSTGNVPINKLWVTIANATGCQAPEGGPMTHWGQFDSRSLEAGITNPGELDALRA
jgi:Protein of unknown function (DUF1552)